MSNYKQNSHPPPRFADRFLRWFCNPELLPEIQGDLHELFNGWVREYGMRRAKWLYVWNVLTFFRPFAIKREKSAYTINHTDMLSNYFKIAFRNLLSKKFYSAINVLGLSIGMTCCMLIFLYVSHELSYDTFHAKADHIYRLVTENGYFTPAPMTPYLKADFPQVREAVRIYYTDYLVQKDNQSFQEEEVIYADAAFFKVFDFSLLRGDAETVLTTPFSIVLTQKLARKYFGEQDPLGKPLLLKGRGKGQHVATVAGIVDVPSNSHIQFDMILSMSSVTEKLVPDIEEQWGNFSFYTFLLLSEGTNPATLASEFPAFLERHVGETMRDEDRRYSLMLEPLTDVYMHSKLGAPIHGNLTNIYIFSIVAGFILLIACINFINLATARATERAKEVGVRKVMGAVKRQLTLQFLMESVLLSLTAGAIAILLAELILPMFNELAGKTIARSIFQHASNISVLLLIILTAGILAGLYPALVLSNFKAVTVLKGRFSSSNQGLWLRKSLVVAQFTVTIILIAGTAVVYSQLNYVRKQPLGFQKEQMLVIDFQGDDAIQQKLDAIKQELQSQPQVLSASASSDIPSDHPDMAGTEIENATGEMQRANLSLYSVDYNFLDQYQIELVAGREFSRQFTSDSTKALIINESAATLFGYASPADAIGKRFSQWGREGEIIGVIKDFHFRSLQERIAPLSLRIAPDNARLITLNLKTTNLSRAITQLEQQWKELVPYRPFNYFFLDEAFDQQYKTEVRFGQLFMYFSGLAIIIACLGLLGLISYTIVQRTKEIGIRKVLGATEISIVRLLSKDFLMLIFVAFTIASPVAWYFLNQWLSNFAYRIDVPWWVFALAGGMALLVAMFTIGFQAIKAALANPVDSLRNE